MAHARQHPPTLTKGSQPPLPPPSPPRSTGWQDEDPRGDCGPFNCIGSGECYEECTNSKGCAGDRLCVGGSYCYDPDRSLSYALVITFSVRAVLVEVEKGGGVVGWVGSEGAMCVGRRETRRDGNGERSRLARPLPGKRPTD